MQLGSVRRVQLFFILLVADIWLEELPISWSILLWAWGWIRILLRFLPTWIILWYYEPVIEYYSFISTVEYINNVFLCKDKYITVAIQYSCFSDCCSQILQHLWKLAKKSKPLIGRLICLYKGPYPYWEFVKGLQQGLKILNYINPVALKSNLW